MGTAQHLSNYSVKLLYFFIVLYIYSCLLTSFSSEFFLGGYYVGMILPSNSKNYAEVRQHTLLQEHPHHILPHSKRLTILSQCLLPATCQSWHLQILCTQIQVIQFILPYFSASHSRKQGLTLQFVFLFGIFTQGEKVE